MVDFVTLACPSCGAKLEITQDIDRFACTHCGMEHIVKRAGGIVALSPVVEAIHQVKTGVDKTAAELAIVRLQKEIASLQEEKAKAARQNPEPKLNDWYPFVFLAGIPVSLTGIYAIFESRNYGVILLIITGFVLVLVGGLMVFRYHPRKIKNWNAIMSAINRKYDEQIEARQKQLKQSRELVSR